MPEVAPENKCLFPALDRDARRSLEELLTLADRLFPLPGRFRSALPRDVAELSGLLTYERRERRTGYMNQPRLLSAYLRYFLHWNSYRLARLLPALPLALKDGDAVTDLGSGPFTFPLALWIARPDLRSLSLEFRCLDRAASALEAGKKLFAALAPGSPWRMRSINAALGAPVRGPKAALVTAVNLFNELDAGSPRETPRETLVSLAAPSGSILAVEPGIPSSGEFIAALRASLAAKGFSPRSPCPHDGACPLSGGRQGREKAKWCHFAFDTQGAPEPLLRLSVLTGIPKERAALSFLLAQAGNADSPPPKDALPVRILSDAFPLPGKPEERRGRYGCSRAGLVLAAGERTAVDSLEAGTLAYFPMPDEKRRDPKSGALVAAVSPAR